MFLLLTLLSPQVRPRSDLRNYFKTYLFLQNKLGELYLHISHSTYPRSGFPSTDGFVKTT